MRRYVSSRLDTCTQHVLLSCIFTTTTTLFLVPNDNNCWLIHFPLSVYLSPFFSFLYLLCCAFLQKKALSKKHQEKTAKSKQEQELSGHFLIDVLEGAKNICLTFAAQYLKSIN